MPSNSQPGATPPPLPTASLMPPALGNEPSGGAAPPPSEEPAAEASAEDSSAAKLVNSLISQFVESEHAEPDHSTINVFYGTDRKRIDTIAANARRSSPVMIPVILVGLLALLGVALYMLRTHQKIKGGISLSMVAGLFLVSVVIASRIPCPIPLDVPDDGIGAEFGSERGSLQLGVCQVTIPNDHDPGELEAPSIFRFEFREREDRHVILQKVEPKSQTEFFKLVRDRVTQSPRRDLFVFVHGYNVTFENAARRTAQMARDLKFEGAPVFYSWPSQGELLDYSIDENNVAWTVPQLRRFISDIVKQSDARAVNLIAHSMGNRALTAALADLKYEFNGGPKFKEVILAAPDIDAEIFKRDIAPIITKEAERVTLYASSRDQALRASKLVHGYARAGDSGEGIVVAEGVETIDVSEVDSSLLGHSYLTSNEPLIFDLGALIGEYRPADKRPWLQSRQKDGQIYWSFDETSLASVRSMLRK